MKVVIIGSTGLVGRKIVDKLLDSNLITSLTSIGRSSLGIKNEKLNEIKSENLNLSFFKSLNIDADVFISALGTTIKDAGSKEKFFKIDHDINFEFASFAKKQFPSTFILISAYGADPNSIIYYNKVKGLLEQEVSELKIETTLFIRPSLLIGDREDKRLLESIGIKSYKALSTFLPKSALSKLGTRPKDICDLILNFLESDQKGLKCANPENIAQGNVK